MSGNALEGVSQKNATLHPLLSIVEEISTGKTVSNRLNDEVTDKNLQPMVSERVDQLGLVRLMRPKCQEMTLYPFPTMW